MDRNPYAPSEAVASASAAGQQESYSARTSALIAVAIESALLIANELVRYDGTVISPTTDTALRCIANVCFVSYCVWILEVVANGMGEDGRLRQFNWWAFLWRAYVAQLVGLVPLVAIKFALFGNATEPAVQIYVVSTIASVVLFPFVVWLLFSKRRASQRIAVMATLRGW